MKIKNAMEKAYNMLKEKNIDDANLKARTIMQFVLKVDRQYILVNNDIELNNDVVSEYFSYIDKILNNMPLQYITNTQEFMKLDFYVDENVLIPRADTEILVEEAIMKANEIKAEKILDICTGSGAIAISVAKYLENISVTASDISENALIISKRNANSNRVSEKLNFIQSDMFENITGMYDIIISNPPYIAKEVILNLEDQVKKEPIIALDGGIDGLDFYRILVSNAYKYLNKGGYLMLEIGYDQKDDVIKLIENLELEYSEIYSKKDLYNNDRVVIAKKS